MSAPKRGLGRGLGALLGDEPTSSDIMHVAVEQIRPNPQQPRKNFDARELGELERSIREIGILVPLIVRAAAQPGVYELIAGERRWRAATAAGLATVPAIVREADDRSSLELAVVENLQRADLDPLEEAAGFAHLIDEYGFTQESLAERLGKSRPSVANGLRLLALSDSIKAEVRAGHLSGGHARALLAFPTEERDALALRTVREDLRVRDLERMATERSGRRRPPETVAVSRPRATEFDDVEERLRGRYAAKIAIVPAPRGGRIEIRYADNADLTRIVDLLLGED